MLPNEAPQNDAIRHEIFERIGLTVDCVFVPFSQSRNCKNPDSNWWKEPNWPSLNWRVTVKIGGKPILTTDYGQGIGHIPGYKSSPRVTLFAHEILSVALETGTVPFHQKPWIAKPGKVPAPDRENIMYSLLLDGAADFDAQSFDEWAGEYGYDPDSRKAESIYNECLSIGRQLRSAISMSDIDALRDAYQDY